MNKREIHEVFESVYAVTMDDDDYVTVSVYDPDEERTDINPGVGVRITGRAAESRGVTWLPCLLVAEDTLGNWLVVTTEGHTIQFIGGTEVTCGSPTEVVRARKIAGGGMDHIEDELSKISEDRPDIARAIKTGVTYVEGPRWALEYLADGLDNMDESDVEYRIGTDMFHMELSEEMRDFGIRSALNSYSILVKRLRDARPVKKGKGKT